MRITKEHTGKKVKREWAFDIYATVGMVLDEQQAAKEGK